MSHDMQTQTTNSTGQTDMNEHNDQPKKTFNFWSALGVAVCCSGAWEGWTASLAQGISGGGPVALLYGWIFVSIGITCVAASMAELASSFPSAGGQYVWVAQIAPKKWAPTLSWFSAWITITGLILGAISCAMGVAVQVQSYAAISRGYEPERLHAFLIVIALVIFWMIINIFAIQLLSPVNQSIIYLHVGGYIAAIITLLAMTKNKNSAEFVFTTSINHTGWTDGIAWCVGQLSSLFAFFSLDTATHFAEETPRREITVPRVIFYQPICNSIATFPFIIVVLFCMGDPIELLDSDIGFLSPFTKIIYQSTGSPAAAIMINGVSTWTAVVAVGDLLGASARIIWSLGRDEALPERWGRLSKRWHVPIPALLVQLVVVIPVAMIYIWNGTAFYGVMGATVVCFQISYFMPIALKVFRYNRTQSLLQGPWKMGRIGFVVDIISMCFGAFMIIFISFPMVSPVTAENMNYACVIVAAACVFASTLWFCYARNRYEAHISVLEAVNGTEDSEVVSVHKAQHKNVEFHA